MSYIRCLSNPEGLYVIGTSFGPRKYVIQLMPAADYKHTNLDKETSEWMNVPLPVFFGAVLKTERSFDDEVRFKGFSAKEVQVFADTGEPVPKDYDDLKEYANAIQAGKAPREIWFAIRVEYKEKWMLLWKVTWRYLVQSALPDARKWENPRRPGLAWWLPEKKRKK